MCLSAPLRQTICRADFFRREGTGVVSYEDNSLYS